MLARFFNDYPYLFYLDTAERARKMIYLDHAATTPVKPSVGGNAALLH